MLQRIKRLLKYGIKRVFEIGGFNVVRPVVLEQLASALQRQERVAAELSMLQRIVADLKDSTLALKDSILGQREPREILLTLQDLAVTARKASAEVNPGSEALRGLAHHYAVCANLVAEYHLFRGRREEDPFVADDGTLEFVKKTAIYVPGNEVDIDPNASTFPWTDMFSDPDCGVFLIMGQSNAGNHGSERYQPSGEVYTLNFMDMKCYRANDPLPGTSGDGGSIWSRLGDRLIAANAYSRVLFVPLAFGGTFVRDWIPGGAFNRRLAITLSRLQRWLGQEFLNFSAVIWQQGEAEANHTRLSGKDYRQSVLELIADLRTRGVFCPVFSTVSTTCEAGPHEFQNHAAIRKAQLELPESRVGILLGPDTDTIGATGRFDGCHFSASGLSACADMWFETIQSKRSLLLTR